MLIPLTYAKRLIDSGYSLIVSDEKKIPIGSWKQCQKIPFTKEQFEEKYNSPKANYVGLITGFNGIECIDVDLKVFATLMTLTLNL
jgi:hypothetical protein